MKKNEIAESEPRKAVAVQAVSASSGHSTPNHSDPFVPSANPQSTIRNPQSSPSPWTIIDTSGIGSFKATTTANVVAAASPTSARMEQVERLITREVMTVRQSGAQALAVSLKVDSHTSLFLQLTNHHGQVEASVRCEGGDPRALGVHWGQLQESLARQNVQLMPLHGEAPSSQSPSDGSAETAKNFPDGSASQEQKQPAPAPENEVPTDDAMNAAVRLAKPKNKPRFRAWEKWA